VSTNGSPRRGRLRLAGTTTAFLAAVLAVLFSVVPASAAPPPASAAPAAAASTAKAPAAGAPKLARPPTPTRHGEGVAGGWYGPYQLQNLNSSMCVDMGNSTANGAGAIQWTCQSGRPTQQWWVWETVTDCCVGIQWLYNWQSGMCLETWSGHQRGIQLVQGPCNWDETELWVVAGGVTSGFDYYSNQFSDLCMDVDGWSTAAGAAMLQWDCHGGANQVFATRQF
jgi:hypothetical protein